MWFFSADWHLGHANIIKYCKRPFTSPEERGLISMAEHGAIPSKEVRISQESTNRMTNAIIDNTNAVVRPSDTLVIGGDFCWTPREDRFLFAKKFRERINCNNVYLILGNHDDRRVMCDIRTPLFTACYEQYTFNVNGQKVFVGHYPCRSWESSHHGCWNLYGHVHDLFNLEDNGKLMPYENKVFSEGFHSVLDKFGIKNDRDQLVQKLLDVCASVNGIDLTLDIGVDNLIRGEDVPFGTPWSMDEIQDYMNKKKPRWEARQLAYKNLDLL